MSFFFDEYIMTNTPKGKGLYHIMDMHKCWMAGQMSVIKFTEVGGQMSQLKETLEQHRLLEERLEKSGMVDEIHSDIMQEIAHEKEKIDEGIKKTVRDRFK